MAHVGFRSRTEGMVLRADGSSWKCSLVATGRTHPADATDRGLARFWVAKRITPRSKKWGETVNMPKTMGRFGVCVMGKCGVFFFVVCNFVHPKKLQERGVKF